MLPTETILSCDWGTSNFRLRLVETSTYKTLAEYQSDEGISHTFKQWKDGGANPDNRLGIYAGVIKKGIATLEKEHQISTEQVPVIISGMASSTIGMMELPYKEVPFDMDGSNLVTQHISATDSFDHEIFLISGAKTSSDVMRGEETQLAGCKQANEAHEQLLIFPGTHSKHIVVHNSRVVNFKTYMTGELFNLLFQKSILSVSLQEGRDLKAGNNFYFFTKGVTDSQQGNLLNKLFHIRTNQLFNQCSAEENYYYLSGLLIGHELKELQQQPFPLIQIVSTTALGEFYLAALNVFFGAENISIYLTDGGDAVTEGQVKIWKERSVESKK